MDYDRLYRLISTFVPNSATLLDPIPNYKHPDSPQSVSNIKWTQTGGSNKSEFQNGSGGRVLPPIHVRSRLPQPSRRECWYSPMGILCRICGCHVGYGMCSWLRKIIC